MKYCFYGKPNVDYTRYGLIDEGTEWVLWRGTRRITIIKSNLYISFNMITNEVLKIFKDMIVDDVVVCKKHKDHKPRNHYIGLDDEEYKMIQDRRNRVDLTKDKC